MSNPISEIHKLKARNYVWIKKNFSYESVLDHLANGTVLLLLVSNRHINVSNPSCVVKVSVSYPVGLENGPVYIDLSFLTATVLLKDDGTIDCTVTDTFTKKNNENGGATKCFMTLLQYLISLTDAQIAIGGQIMHHDIERCKTEHDGFNLPDFWRRRGFVLKDTGTEFGIKFLAKQVLEGKADRVTTDFLP